MNPEQPPLAFPEPRIEPRRSERNPIMLPAARVDARAETARVLGGMATAVEAQLSVLDDEQRRQAIIKLEHERPVKLVGTGLKLLAPQGEHVTLAVLKEGERDLRTLKTKLNEFGTGPLKAKQPKNPELDGILAIKKGEPTDRLSDGLFAGYPNPNRESGVRRRRDRDYVAAPGGKEAACGTPDDSARTAAGIRLRGQRQFFRARRIRECVPGRDPMQRADAEAAGRGPQMDQEDNVV